MEPMPPGRLPAWLVRLVLSVAVAGLAALGAMLLGGGRGRWTAVAVPAAAAGLGFFAVMSLLASPALGRALMTERGRAMAGTVAGALFWFLAAAVLSTVLGLRVHPAAAGSAAALAWCAAGWLVRRGRGADGPPEG
ncbi:MAG: hypothetical protein JWM27_4132 [Gemmatimonadetes bacterium]|nr:hypothetical protein [Gemmatimonadota bacterium]